jgi:hypothetical protein
MLPIKLTQHLYLNPETIAQAEYTPKGRLGIHEFFTVLFSNSDLQPVHLKGEEADEAFTNWKAWHEEEMGRANLKSGVPSTRSE